ncbi:MAG TPA: hypothetical protein VK357_15235, partial [Rubrobacteraceae bacterium]|nr:hypothetical protein [Rubrobacteraceae bacterium]
MDLSKRRLSGAGLCLRFLIFAVATLLAVTVLTLSNTSQVAGAQTQFDTGASDCAPGVDFLGFSDALNKA